MATTVPQILAPDNAVQALMAVEVGIRWRTIFWFFSIRMVFNLFSLNG